MNGAVLLQLFERAYRLSPKVISSFNNYTAPPLTETTCTYFQNHAIQFTTKVGDI